MLDNTSEGTRDFYKQKMQPMPEKNESQSWGSWLSSSVSGLWSSAPPEVLNEEKFFDSTVILTRMQKFHIFGIFEQEFNNMLHKREAVQFNALHVDNNFHNGKIVKHLTSDCGWGSPIRCVQMLLASTLQYYSHKDSDSDWAETLPALFDDD